MSVNKVFLKGRLGADVDLRVLPDGRAVSNSNLATSERWKDKATGEVKENTEWHRVVAFNKLAEIFGKHFTKGDEVYIEGKLRTRKWQDKEGVDRYTTEIVADTFDFCGSKSSGSGDAKAQQQADAYAPPVSAYEGARGDDFDDDIPF